MADVFGTSSDDTLTGGDGNDTLNGYAGNDILSGGAGSDVLDGGDGSDTLTGGAGNDQINGGNYNMYAGPSMDVAIFSGNRADYEIIRVSIGTYMNGAPGDTYTVKDMRPGSPDGEDTVVGFELFRFADGDVSPIDLGVVITGGSSADTLDGTSGADRLSGGGADDVLYGNGGDDELTGGSGRDTLHGGTGNDTAIYSGNRSDYTVTLLAGGDVEVKDNRTGSPDGTDRVSRDVEQLKFSDGTETVAVPGVAPMGTVAADTFTGSDGNDTLNGHTGDDVLSGGAGSDVLDGGPGSDTLTGGAGNDQINGGNYDMYDGPSIDVAIFSGNRADYEIVRVFTATNMNGTPGDTFRVKDLRAGSPDGEDLAIGIETFRFADGDVVTATLGSVITGGDWMDSLQGTAGADKISGGGSDDYLYGNGGDDDLIGGSGRDTLYGGAGTDTAIYSGNRSDYTVTEIAGGDVEIKDNRIGSPDGVDLVGRDVEKLKFADTILTLATTGVSLAGASADDTLTGSDGDDTLFGNAGNEVIAGNDGRDILNGGDGSDTLIGGAGNDQLNGGSYNMYGSMEVDVVTFSGNRSDYEISRSSSSIDLPMYGQTYRVKDLRAGSPDGDDLVVNFETFRFADGDIATSAIGLVITGGDVADQLQGTAGADRISGGGSADSLFGNGGDDELTGGSGNDTLKGGAGNDMAIYSGNRLDYTVTLLAGGDVEVKDNRLGSPDGTDVLARDVETVRFADNAETVAVAGIDQYGTFQADTLVGGIGNDTLTGIIGNDTLVGGAGSDLLDGGDGSDTLTGGAGNDWIDGGYQFYFGVPKVDIATYSGNRSDYEIVRITNGTLPPSDRDPYRVKDLRDGSPDGEDLVVSVETFRFADGDVASTTIGAVIAGGPGIDYLQGTTGPDKMSGGGSDDFLYGNGGDDELTGGSGRDKIYGGVGTDTAVFSGNRSNYTITMLSGGDVQVRDNRLGSPDGTDFVSRDVEFMRFADQTLSTTDTDADVGDDLRVVIGDGLVGAAEKSAVAYTVSGTDTDATATVMFSGLDKVTGAVLQVTGVNGTVDLTGFADGVITASVSVRDTAGNTATGVSATTVLDTHADLGDDLRVVIGDGLIGAAEKSAVAYMVSGTDTDATATVMFSGLDKVTGAVLQVTGVNGTVDLTGFADGVVTASVSVRDTAGNTATGVSATTVLDTTAPTPVILNIIKGTVSQNLIGISEAGSAIEVFSGDLKVGTTTADSAGNWALTVSSSTASQGFTVRSTDLAGNIGNSGLTLFGSDRGETLSGANTDDVIFGNGGNDVIFGGSGNDRFIFNAPAGRDTISDFSAGAGSPDVIWFEDALFTSHGLKADFATLMLFAKDTVKGVQISYGGDSITLTGVDKADLHSEDFFFF